jgi:hypothetical protein
MIEEKIKYNYYIFIYIALILIVYTQTFSFDFALDDDLIKENIDGKIFAFSDLAEIFKHRYNRVEYRPIAILTFGIEHLIFGEISPKVSHIVNVMLFIFIIISLHIFLRLLFNGKYKSETFFMICIFAVHPLCVEVVANIKSRDGLLSMFFSIWSLYFFIKAKNNSNSIRYFIISFILFIIGSFAKLDVFGVIIFILLYHINQWNKKSIIQGLILLGIFTIGVSLIRTALIDYLIPIEESNSTLAVTTFTENPIANLNGFLLSIFAGIQTNCIYLSKIIFPNNLCYYYGYNYYTLDTTFSLKIFLEFILSMLILLIIIYFNRKNKFIFLAAMAYFSFIFYALNYITSVAGIVADRYVFQALFWFIVLAILILTQIISINKPQSKIFFTILILVSTIAAYNRVGAWENNITLIETDAPKLKQSFEGMRIAASIYYDDYEKTNNTTSFEKAILCAQNANKIYPENLVINTQLGQFYFKKGYIVNAKKYLTIASKVDSTNATVFHYLGDIFYTQKQYNLAEINFKKAYLLAKNKQKQILINNISTLYYEQNLLEKCVAYNQTLITQDSSNYAALENLGYYYINQKDTLKAKTYFELAEKHGLEKNQIPSF